MVTEETAVKLQQVFGPIVDVKDVAILNNSEFTSETTPPEWYNQAQDQHILRLEFHADPKNYIIQQISQVCHHTQSQVYHTDDTGTKNTVYAYICPTTNSFSSIYELVGEPRKERVPA